MFILLQILLIIISETVFCGYIYFFFSLSNKLGKEIRVGKNSLSKKGFQYLVEKLAK